jgi:nicotinate-nucleotide--dimethylbenzimidazole phosphoribosyltransferase
MTYDPVELEQRVRARHDQLTKPPGSLGYLEDIAVRFAVIKREEMPSCARKGIYVFCADHGVVEEGVSAYPREVTHQMMRNYVGGGAAISVLARRLEAVSIVVDVGCSCPVVPGVLDRKVASGTRNFTQSPAMTRDQAKAALAVGAEMAEGAADRFDLVGLGEMGIGNTTVAAAILSAITGCDPRETVGPGSGVSAEGIHRKVLVIRRALELHSVDLGDGIGVLSAVGGFEIGAIAGFILRAAELRLAVVVDGFPCTAGAMIAQLINPDALETVFFSHTSTEPGHRMMIAHLAGRAWFDFGLRLGEGTGAAIMMGIIDLSVRLYREMATFAEASVDAGPASPVTKV